MTLKIKNNKKALFIITIPVVSLLGFWLINLSHLWTNGISSIVLHPNTIWTGQLIEDEHSITIDLVDLKGNIGKELYNDGSHKIYVKDVINNSRSNSFEYTIMFRSSGIYSMSNASLVSGGLHMKKGEDLFSSQMSAKMTAEYEGTLYTSKPAGMSGAHYKDGDDFSFHIFSKKEHDAQNIRNTEPGKVHITVSNLYKNIWEKK